MTDTLATIRDHYRANGLTERLRTALAAFGPEDHRLTPAQMASFDQFHTRGLAATAELVELAGITSDMSVLDIGAGIGGPARYIASTRGCQVTGVDVSVAFVEAARYLTARTGQGASPVFQIADALELPFDDAAFDIALLQHVAMNILDRASLYGEVRRVLKPGGRFATYDVVSAEGEPHYPLPWARTPATSFLLTGDRTRELIESAGFRLLALRDDTEAAKTWIEHLRASPPPAPNLGLVMGADFPKLATNLGRSLMQGRLGILTAVFEAVSASA